MYSILPLIHIRCIKNLIVCVRVALIIVIVSLLGLVIVYRRFHVYTALKMGLLPLYIGFDRHHRSVTWK